MLFNSYLFIFVFLPVVLAGFGILARRHDRRACLLWLVASSLFYYGWWNPNYLALLGLSVVINFGIGNRISRRAGTAPGRMALLVGVGVNLAVLGYFKYASFLVENAESLLNKDWNFPPIVLPLAISFFTFQQIAFLVDAYRGDAKEYSFLEYTLFVTFFPQLIAGPIVHHKEMMPQFERSEMEFQAKDFSVGLTMFALGLSKKVLLADTMATFASSVFSLTESGITPPFALAWAGMLAYSLQIYFDFSGYSDMAIGLARLFGIRLPLNFASPYKSGSIVEFWRRWHMTLSRFLRDYLYFPLGGNRLGEVRRHINLMVTMLLGGLWHGAGWNFVVWGGLHGSYLVINHLWSRVCPTSLGQARSYRILSRGLTFVAVLFAWVFFRAVDFSSAWNMFLGLVARGRSLSVAPLDLHEAWPKILICLALAFWAPNSQEIMNLHQEGVEDRAHTSWWQWRPSYLWAVLATGVLAWSVLKISSYSEFIYFQF